jgi:hypothetical protein
MRQRENLSWMAVCALAMSFGCAGSPANSGGGGTGAMVACPQGTPGCPMASPATGGSGATTTQVGTAGTMGVPPGGKGGTTGAGGAAGIAPAAAGGVPCGVAAIISKNCTGCHQNPIKNAAPMPLMALADFQAAAKSDATKKVYQVIPGRLTPTDPQKRMPPPAVLDALPDTDKKTLNDWLSGGALGAATNACPITVTEIPGTTNQGDCEPPGSGGAHTKCVNYTDMADITCYKFLTHAQGNNDAPYSMAPGEQYYNFDFKAPWTGTVYERMTRLANDPNSKVIHHWLLFQMTGPAVDGSIALGNGTHGGANLVHAWGPGASPLYFDPDVGLPLSGDVGYELEAHMNNQTGAPGDDHSGAEVCVTSKVPAHPADLVWVGTDSIAGTSATGSCTPTGPFPIHVIAAQPHMHKLGSNMKVTVNHSNGMSEVVHDKVFSFDAQQYYVKNFQLMQGDTMTTECSYSGFATFGTSTSNEMCYFFSVAWPAGALRGGFSIHGSASCM